jgi:hypothetical protein
MMMQSIYKKVSGTWLILILLVLMSPSAQAHLMVAQHGTLNIVDDGAFMVLSLPISAFVGIDDDNDGKVSMIEFNLHRAAIVQSVGQNITLSRKDAILPLQGVMLSPVVPHDDPEDSLSQLIVMGRFSLSGNRGELRFQASLFGEQASEKVMKITVTHKSDSQKHVFEITPVMPAGVLFL